MDNALGLSERSEVQKKRGEELRNHLVQSRSVALIKVGAGGVVIIRRRHY